MELVRSHKVSFEEIQQGQLDVVITSCGLDWRSVHLIQHLNQPFKKKIAIQYANHFNPTIKDFLLQKGFSIYEVKNNTIIDYFNLFNQLCNGDNCEDYKIVFDYSSMPQVAYGAFINYISCLENELKNITVYFSFTQGNYLKTNLSNQIVKPEVMFPNFSETQLLQKALILGVNHNNNDTKYLIDFFKPDQCFLFMPKQSIDDTYYRTIADKHETLTNKHGKCLMTSYYLDNLDEIDRELTAICLRLRLDHKIQILSNGPESFALSTYLLHSRYPDIEIWHASPNKTELAPIDMPIIHKAVFTSEGDDY